MNSKDIRSFFKSTLNAASTGMGEGWPNVDNDNDSPKFELSFYGISSDVRPGVPETLKGNEIQRETGSTQVLITVEKGQGEDAALDFGDAVVAAFPSGHNAITGGSVTILQRPTVEGGYETSEGYNVPVTIRYTAVSS